MGIIEIVLTIIAWRKGWKWISIFPMTTAVIIGTIIGFNNPDSYVNHPFDLIWIDGIAIIILIFMCFKEPSK